MKRTAVGSRELKTKLGTYLQQVRHGRTFVVTDRGEPVAELRPIDSGGDSIAGKLARLSVEGTITRERSRPLTPFKATRPSPSVSAAGVISEEREDRF